MPKNVHYHTVMLISPTIKVMLKILQGRLPQYVNQEFPHVQSGLREGRETRDQIASIHWIMERAREFQKNMYFCFIDYTKAFYCVGHNKLWKTLKEMAVPDHFTCLLKNLHAGQEAIELNMEQQIGSKLGKEYVKSVYCHPACLTYMQTTSCEMPAGWTTSWNRDCQEKYQQPQICRWYHSNAESEEELKSLLKVKEEWKSCLKTQHSKNEDYCI